MAIPSDSQTIDSDPLLQLLNSLQQVFKQQPFAALNEVHLASLLRSEILLSEGEDLDLRNKPTYENIITVLNKILSSSFVQITYNHKWVANMTKALSPNQIDCGQKFKYGAIIVLQQAVQSIPIARKNRI